MLVSVAAATTAAAYKLSTAASTPNTGAFKASNTTRNLTVCFSPLSATTYLKKACNCAVPAAPAAAASTAATVAAAATAAGRRKRTYMVLLNLFMIFLSRKGEQKVRFYFLAFLYCSPFSGRWAFYESTSCVRHPVLGSLGFYFLKLFALFCSSYDSTFWVSVPFCYHHVGLYFLNLLSFFLQSYTVLLLELLFSLLNTTYGSNF